VELQIKEESKRIDKSLTDNIDRAEYLNRQVQSTKGGLLECMQKLAGKAEKKKVDKQERMIKELQKFNEKELKKELTQKIKENKGKETCFVS
jgi:hypothetical protein